MVDQPGAGASLWIRFLSGPDIDALGLTGAEIVDAVEGAVLAHGEGRVVFEPRVHLVPGWVGVAGHERASHERYERNRKYGGWTFHRCPPAKISNPRSKP